MAGGAANLTWIFDEARFKLTGDEPRCFQAKPESGGTFFCDHCGVQVFPRPDRNPNLVAIKVGAFDDATGFKVQADMWMSSAPPWHSAHAGAAQYKGNITREASAKG
jgi:hypothetical protein